MIKCLLLILTGDPLHGPPLRGEGGPRRGGSAERGSAEMSGFLESAVVSCYKRLCLSYQHRAVPKPSLVILALTLITLLLYRLLKVKLNVGTV